MTASKCWVHLFDFQTSYITVCEDGLLRELTFVTLNFHVLLLIGKG